MPFCNFSEVKIRIVVVLNALLFNKLDDESSVVDVSEDYEPFRVMEFFHEKYLELWE